MNERFHVLSASRLRRTAAAILVLCGSWACGTGGLGGGSRGVTISGSDTMLELNRRLAAAFMQAYPQIPVRVAGGGTGAGVMAMVAGETDLAASSRPLTADEVAAIHDRYQTLGVRVLLARDALSVYLHPSNPLTDLSSDELRQLFSGEIDDWSELGGDARPVSVVIRPPTSGSHRFFRDHVLRGAPYSPSAAIGPRTADVLDLVAADPGAIGFGGLAQGPDLIHSAVDGARPTEENIRQGRYPLTRYLVYYASAPPEGPIRAFLDWCLSAEGQRIVREVGFVPLWSPPS
jgi:phosphate transport system substrate-binding protein